MRLLSWLLVLLSVSLMSEAAPSRPEQDTPSLTQEMTRLLQARFRHAGVDYPPERVQLIALKKSRKLELWAWDSQRWNHIHDYPVFAASGHTGPKLREGDRQVPEGFYRIDALNPNSKFHLSLKLNYPNAFDWKQAAEEGRKNPGSNIFIHGSAWSAGCLAIGNRSVEELYTLVSRVGTDKAHVLIAPYDFRARAFRVNKADPDWLQQLYSYINLRMEDFPLAEKRSECSLDCLLEPERLTLENKRQGHE